MTPVACITTVFKWPRLKLCSLFAVSILIGSSAFSAQTFIMTEQERLKATISAKELNRLQVVGDRIASVFGAPNVFSLEHEDVKGQVFLKVHEGAPAHFDVSVVTESGLTQDLLLKVNKEEGQTLLLKPQTASQDLSGWGDGVASGSVSVDLIRLMASHTPNSGYLKQQVSRPLPLWRDLRLTLTQVWKGSELEGRVYKITNTGDRALKLQESQFCLSPKVKALALKQHSLNPGETTTLWEVVSYV